MKVVYAHLTEFFKPNRRLERLIGKSFASYGKLLQAMQPGDTVTTQHVQGYKAVGIDKDGKAWVQRSFVPEF